MRSQYESMMAMIDGMDPMSRALAKACIEEFQAVAKKYGAMSVIALAVMSAKHIDEGEQHGKD